jgi:hypothetical protein
VVGYVSSTTCTIVQTPAVITSGTAETAVTWGSARKDVSAMFTTGAPTRLTCKQAGTYECNAFLDWGTNATGIRILWILKNGVTHVAGNIITPNLFGSPQSASGLFDLAVGDYLEATAIQNSGGNITPAGLFSAVRVSP